MDIVQRSASLAAGSMLILLVRSGTSYEIPGIPDIKPNCQHVISGTTILSLDLPSHTGHELRHWGRRHKTEVN
jgi:hypothetical protein